MRNLLRFILTFMMFGCMSTLFAQGLVPIEIVPPPDRPGHPEQAIECTKQIINVTIDNQIAKVQIEQTFVNHTERNLEAVYILPLHETASISRFSYWVKGKEIKGEVKEKGEARRDYDSIVAQQRDPALLENIGRNMFRASVFPVSPTEPMKVVVEYEQICDYRDGKVSFSYPLTAGGQEQKIGMFALNATIKDQKPLAGAPIAMLGGVNCRQVDDHTASVSFETTNYTPAKDFEFTYELKSTDFGVSFLSHRIAGADGYFMLMVAPQELTTESDIVKKDMIFVFDRSGSMSGEKIQQAREALKFCLNGLNADDRFNVVTFSDDVQKLNTSLLPANSENISTAIKAAEKIEASGGTNINQALSDALSLFSEGTNQKTVIFLTDGLPTVGETEAAKIISNIKKVNEQDVRLFTFGVGDDVDDYLLLKLAKDNHGSTQTVRGGQSIETKVSSFFKDVSTPVLINLALDFGEINPKLVYPQVLPDIFKGRQLIVLGRYEKSGEQNIKLSGVINGKQRSFIYPANFANVNETNSFLPRLWAKARVDWVIDNMRLNGENKELKDEVIALSKQYMFITPYTSFLAMPNEEKDLLEARRQSIATTPPSPSLGVPVGAAGPKGSTGTPRRNGTHHNFGWVEDNFATGGMSAPAYPVGGDPVIRLKLTDNARSIEAIYPWGDTTSLTRTNQNPDIWTCRFIVPKTIQHGEYGVVLIITWDDNTKSRVTVNFQADREAPGGSGSTQVTPTADGWNVKVSVTATADTHRVLALLPGQGKVELQLNAATGNWEVDIPFTGATGDLVQIPLVLFDRGHNRVQLDIEVELR